MRQEENSIIVDDSEQEEFFFDSYAIFEILNGNVNYKRYEDAKVIITKLNIFEIYLKTLRNSGEKNANEVMDKYISFSVDFDEEVIKEAAKLKILLNKRDVSMTDCIGYCLAKQLGIRFLTGDEAFINLENVEYVR